MDGSRVGNGVGTRAAAWRRGIRWLLLVMGVLLICACGGGDEDDPAPPQGQLQTALSWVSDGEEEYRLREAKFRVSGPDDFRFSSEDYLEQSVATFDVADGKYTMKLSRGWYLERRVGGADFEPVEAVLHSKNPQAFSIDEKATTRVTWVFEVDGDIVAPSEGNLEVGIVVLGGEGSQDDGGASNGVCGDDHIDPGEECDDGNDVDTDLCTNACRFARCGDGIIWINQEDCDDGNTEGGDGCPPTCIGQCGNGVIDPGEECDTGEDVSDTVPNACRTDCTDPSCGDGVIDDELGEDCDLGLSNGNSNGCSRTCTLTRCGNGWLTPAKSATTAIPSTATAAWTPALGTLVAMVLFTWWSPNSRIRTNWKSVTTPIPTTKTAV